MSEAVNPGVAPRRTGIRTWWRALPLNPVLGLELRRMRHKRLCPSWWPGRRLLHLLLQLLAAVALGVGLAAAVLPQGHRDSLGFVLDFVFSILVWGLPWLAFTYTAPAIVSERQTGTLGLLRATPLGEEGTVLGKLAGGLARFWPTALIVELGVSFRAAWGAWTRGVYTIGYPWQAEGPGLAYLVVLAEPLADMALVAALGLFVSSRARSPGAASATSFALAFAVRLGFWMIWVLVLVFSTVDFSSDPAFWSTLLEAVGIPVKLVLTVLLLRWAVWRLGRE